MAKVKQKLEVIVKALSIHSNSNQEPSPIQTQADSRKIPAHWKTIFFIVGPLVLGEYISHLVKSPANLKQRLVL